MRFLTASLLLGTLSVLIALGWLLDVVYSRFNSTQLNQVMGGNVIHSAEIFGRDLTLAASASADPQAWLASWPRDTTNIQPEFVFLSEAQLPEEVSRSLDLHAPLIVESEQSFSIYYPLTGHDALLQLSFPAADVHTGASLRVLLTVGFYLVVAALLAAWLVPLLRRLILLRRSAQAFGQGVLDTRVTTSRFSYISDIEIEFNRMASRIQQLVDDNKLMSSAMSHDLRTPLARLRFGLDALVDRMTDQEREANHKYLDRLSSDIEAMQRLISALLRFARLDTVINESHKDAVDLGSLLEDVAEACDDDRISLQLPDTPVRIEGHADYLSMLINNLLDNALRYAEKHVKVLLVTGNSQDHWAVKLSIEDDGQGIKHEDVARLIQPFQRGTTKAHTSDKMHSASDAGHGLGLAIAERISRWHGAELKIGSSDTLGGARVDVLFIREARSSAE